MYELLYVSNSVGDWHELRLERLLRECRELNDESQITGLLLFDGETFLQLIEGSRETVLNLYDSICKDPRHENVTAIAGGPVESRRFAQWSMAYGYVPECATPEDVCPDEGPQPDPELVASLQRVCGKLTLIERYHQLRVPDNPQRPTR